MFLLIILRTSLIFIKKRNVKLNWGTFFLWISNGHSIIYDNFDGIRDPLKQNVAIQFCENQKKDASILTETHISLDQIHHIRNSSSDAIFFSPEDGYTKGLIFLLYMGLKVSLRLTLIQKGSLCPLRLLPLMTEFSVFMPWA